MDQHIHTHNQPHTHTHTHKHTHTPAQRRVHRDHHVTRERAWCARLSRALHLRQMPAQSNCHTHRHTHAHTYPHVRKRTKETERETERETEKETTCIREHIRITRCCAYVRYTGCTHMLGLHIHTHTHTHTHTKLHTHTHTHTIYIHEYIYSYYIERDIETNSRTPSAHTPVTQICSQENTNI